jgi:hypothetical protein
VTYGKDVFQEVFGSPHEDLHEVEEVDPAVPGVWLNRNLREPRLPPDGMGRNMAHLDLLANCITHLVEIPLVFRFPLKVLLEDSNGLRVSSTKRIEREYIGPIQVRNVCQFRSKS